MPERAPLNKVVEAVLQARQRGASHEDEVATAASLGWQPEELKARVQELKSNRTWPLFGGIADAAMQGLTFGFDDELSAAAYAPVRAYKEGVPLGEAYRRGLEENRTDNAVFRAQHPVLATTAEVGGAVLAPGGIGGRAATATGRIAKGALEGGGAAFVSGAGHSEGSLLDRFRAGTQAAPLGGLLGGTVGTLGEGARLIGNPNAVDTAAAATRQGVTPTLGQIGARGTGMIEQAGAQNWVTGGPVRQAAERNLAEAQAASDRVTAGLAGGGRVADSPAEGGALARRFAGRAGERLDQEMDRRLNVVVSMVGANRPTSAAPVVQLRQQMLAELAEAPESLERVYRPALDEIDNILADAGPGGTLPYQATRRIRTMIGKLLKSPEVATGYVGGAGAQMERVYGALRHTLLDTAAQAGPAAEREARRFDRYVRMLREAPEGREAALDVINGVLARGDDLKAWQYLTGGDANRLARFRSSLRPEEWDSVAASVWDQLGRRRAGQSTEFQDWSLETFLTNWNKLKDRGQRRAVFGGTRYAPVAQAMDDLAVIASSGRDLEKLRNTSNTAGALINSIILLGSGNAALQGQGAQAVAALLGGYGVAKIAESGPVLRFLTRALAEEARQPGTWSPERLRGVIGNIAAQTTRGEDDAGGNVLGIPLPGR